MLAVHQEDAMIAVGVSGGVDSSVAALLLKRAGHDVRGIFMHNWETNDPACRAEADRLDALRVCAALDIPFSTLNFADTYKREVFARFLEDYARGITPNPDVLCNREVKFKVFLDAALAAGAQYVATGHYARKARVGDRWALLRAVDPSKDQSYFLQAITQSALAHAMFPLGALPKVQVRHLAAEAGLVTAKKKDSTGICFIGEQDFKTFLSRYLPAQPGQIVDESGRVLGQHPGALYYTAGQRAPLGGVKGAADQPWFVLAKDVANNRLVVGQGADHPRLMASGLATAPASWIAGDPPSDQFDAQVQIRHLGQAHPARVEVRSDGTLSVRFQDPVRAVAAGQAAAIYQGDVCLGGAEIAQAL
jgi:tRNA-specific 2-thiouridylase